MHIRTIKTKIIRTNTNRTNKYTVIVQVKKKQKNCAKIADKKVKWPTRRLGTLRRQTPFHANVRGFPCRVRQTRAAVDVVGKWSQAVVSRSDSDKTVTRLVGEMTSLSLGELACRQIDRVQYTPPLFRTFETLLDAACCYRCLDVACPCLCVADDSGTGKNG